MKKLEKTKIKNSLCQRVMCWLLVFLGSGLETQKRTRAYRRISQLLLKHSWKSTWLRGTGSTGSTGPTANAAQQEEGLRIRPSIGCTRWKEARPTKPSLQPEGATEIVPIPQRSHGCCNGSWRISCRKTPLQTHTDRCGSGIFRRTLMWVRTHLPWGSRRSGTADKLLCFYCCLKCTGTKHR